MDNNLFLLYQKAILKIAHSFYEHPLIQEDQSLLFDDIVQEVSIAWIKAFQTYNKDRGSLNTHFHNVANNHMKDFLKSIMRNAKIHKPVFVPLDEAYDVEAPDLIGAMERTEAITTILNNNLSERDAQIVLMHFGVGQEDEHGLTQRELAEEFGLARETIRDIIHRALSNPDIVEQLQDTFV